VHRKSNRQEGSDSLEEDQLIVIVIRDVIVGF
jgi:hypothetical protein